MTEELNVSRQDEVVTSGGNVFADLGLAHSNEDMLKIAIARAITLTIQSKDITQVEAARLIGTDQAKVSNILRGRLNGFSVDRLMGMLLALGRDIEVRISDRSRNRPGRLSIRAA